MAAAALLAATALLVGAVAVPCVAEAHVEAVAEITVPTGVTAVGDGALAMGLAPSADVAKVLTAVRRVGVVGGGPLERAGVLRVGPGRGGAGRLAADLRSIPGVAWVEAPHIVRALAAPNDPRFWDQWALGVMQVARAWEVSPGSAAVTVAVVDSGVGPHVDLVGKILPGRSFVAGQSSNDTVDRNGHGTAMTDLIAANVHDHLGVAGVAQRVRILPVTVLDAQGVGNDQDAAQGIVWAVDQGADVINVSLGGEWPSEALKAAVVYARERGAVIVAAAGNDGPTAATRYPAAYPEVIAVGAVDRSDVHLDLSNSGAEVDVAAPGASIMAPDFFSNGVAGLGYRLYSGTSFSAAYVAGVAALLLSFDPTMTPAEVQRLLEVGAVDVGPPGRDDQTGAGRVDVARSLAAAQGRTALPGDVTAPRPALVVNAESSDEVEAAVRLSVGLVADDDRAGVQVRRTLIRPARSPDEGDLVADVVVGGAGILLSAEDAEPPWTADPAVTAAYYTAFVRDSAGNWSNPTWVVARAPGAALPVVPEPGLAFPDVPSGHTFSQAIGALSAQGVIAGFADGTFGPDQSVTRAQIAKMVVLALGLGPSEEGTGLPATFADVPAADGYPFVFVEAAAARGIVRGLGDGTSIPSLFGPDRSVTRVQVAQVLSRAGGDKLDLPPSGIVEPFYDLPAYAVGEVSSVWEMGIVKGRSATSFDPWKPATRGEVAEMLYRLEQVLAARP